MSGAYTFGAVPLGAIGMVASWRRPTALQKNRAWPAVIVMQASTSDDGVFTPAADVMVSGRDALLALRSAIDEALKEDWAQGQICGLTPDGRQQ